MVQRRVIPETSPCSGRLLKTYNEQRRLYQKVQPLSILPKALLSLLSYFAYNPPHLYQRSLICVCTRMCIDYMRSQRGIYPFSISDARRNSVHYASLYSEWSQHVPDPNTNTGDKASSIPKSPNLFKGSLSLMSETTFRTRHALVFMSETTFRS
jgi:hypothetical protein